MNTDISSDWRTGRQPWVDIAKGLGILLVVLGHAIRGLFSAHIASPDGWVGMLDEWIYSFHMPLFFFLSGLFLERAVNRPNAFISRAQSIVYPYILWSIIQTSAQMAFSSQANASVDIYDILNIAIYPIAQFWFLYVLFIIQITYLGFRKAGLPLWSLFILSLILSMVSIAGVDLHWGVLYLVSQYYGYLVLGALLRDRLASASTQSSVILISAGFFLLFVMSCRIYMDGQPIELAGLGIAGSCSLAMGLRERYAKPLMVLGQYSLEIYAAHVITGAVIRTLLVKAGITDVIVHLLLQTLGGSILPIILAKLTGPWLFRWPKT